MSEVETDMDQVTDSERGDQDSLISDTDFHTPRMRTREKNKQKQAIKRTRSVTKSPPNKKEKTNASDNLKANVNSQVLTQLSPPTTSSGSNNCQSSFFTTNPFASLTSKDTDKQIDNVDKSFKPPPIYVKQVANFLQLCKKLEETIGKDSFTCKTRASDTIFNFKTPAFFRRAVHFFEEKKAPFHTYQLKEDKAFRVVLRNLHPSTPTTVIHEELEEKGFSVRNVVNILQRGTKTPLPLFFVDLNPDKMNKEIFNVQFIAYSKVLVEEPHVRKEIIQCLRCQNYGHSKKYCHYVPRCLKCAGNHAPQDCPHPRTEPCVCALCGSDHPANYKGCVKYKELRDHRRKPRFPLRETRNGAPVNSTTPASCDSQNFPPLQGPSQDVPAAPSGQAPRSFSNVVRGQRTTNSQVPPPSPVNDLSALFSSFSNIFTQLKNLLSPVIPIFQSILSTLIPALFTK